MGHVKIITLIDFHGIMYYEIIIVREKIDFKNQKQETISCILSSASFVICLFYFTRTSTLLINILYNIDRLFVQAIN